MPPRRYRVNAPQRQPGRCAGAHCTSLLGYGIFATTFGSRATVGGGQGGGRRRPLCRQPEWRRARSCSGRPVRQAKAPPTQTRMVRDALEQAERTPTETMPLPATIPYGTTTRLLGGPRHRVRRVRRIPARSARAQGTPAKSRCRVPQRRGKHRERRPLPRLRRLHGAGQKRVRYYLARLPPELLLLFQPQPAGLRPLPHPRLSLGRRAGGLRPAGRQDGQPSA